MNTLIIRKFGLVDYQTIWDLMKDFTQKRTPTTLDEIWCLQHFQIYTQGQAGKPEHVLDPGIIPVLKTDRGGQVTYHGPGQLVVYPLIDLHRKQLGLKALIHALEGSVIALLADNQIPAHTHAQGPGVYVNDQKIAFMGLRIRRGCSYHGMSLNHDMDLGPFANINPCGHSDLKITQLKDLGVSIDKETLATRLMTYLTPQLGYTVIKE